MKNKSLLSDEEVIEAFELVSKAPKTLHPKWLYYCYMHSKSHILEDGMDKPTCPELLRFIKGLPTSKKDDIK